MSTAAKPYEYLARDPKSAYRQLRVKGRRTLATTLYDLSVGEDRQTPEDIAAEYGLPVEAVLEAIAYCQSNPPEIAADLAREEARMRATGMDAPDYKYHGKPRLLTAQDIAGLDNA
jgi:hypothetical protein